MANGEEPPFDLKDLLRRYGPSPPNPEVPAQPSSSALAKNQSEYCAFSRKDGLRPMCCCVNFKLHVGSWDICVCFQMEYICVRF